MPSSGSVRKVRWRLVQFQEEWKTEKKGMIWGHLHFNKKGKNPHLLSKTCLYFLFHKEYTLMLFIDSTEQWQANLLKIVLHCLMTVGKKHFPGRHLYLQRSFLCIALSPHNSVSVLYLDSVFQNTNLIAINCLVRYLTSYYGLRQSFNSLSYKKQINTANFPFWFSAWAAQMTTFVPAQGRGRKCRKGNGQLREDGLFTDTECLSFYDLN